MEAYTNSVEAEVLGKIENRSRWALIDRERLPGTCANLAVIHYPPDSQAPAHTHGQQTEIYYCLRGAGQLRVGDKTFDLKPGTVAYVPPGVEHQTSSAPDSEMEFLTIFVPPSDSGK